MAREQRRVSTPSSATPLANNEAISPSAASTVKSASAAADGAVAPKRQPDAKPWTPGAYALAMAAMAVLVVGVLAVPHHPAERASDSSDGKAGALDQPIATAGATDSTPHVATMAAPALRADVVTAAAPKAPAKPPQSPAAVSSPRVATKPNVVNAKDADHPEVKLASADTSAAIVPIAAAPLPASAMALSTVTITGCLEVRPSDEQFRLTDTDGASAPKSRSWKTGFLKKRPAAVNLTGDVNAPVLEHQVGKRVAVTGVQTDRDMTVSTVRVVSPSCN